MAQTSKYSSAETLRGDEYRLVGDEIKKIVTIETYEYQIDAFDSYTTKANGYPLDRPLVNWLQSEQGEWLAKRWLRPPDIVQSYSPDTYDQVYRVFVRLWEEDAVFYTLKWK